MWSWCLFIFELFFSRRRPRFEQVAFQVLAMKNLKSENTRLSARRQIDRLTKYFGRRRICNIKESDWIEYVLFEQQKGPRKFFDDRKYMRMILLHALRQGIIARKIALPIPDIDEPVGRELSADELRRLRGKAGRELRFQIDIAWKMGLRKREMLRLRWQQFDWGRRTIRISAAGTKTRRWREVPIPLDLYREFRRRHRSAESPCVFPSPQDPEAPQGSNKTAWRRCKRHAGVRARWHDLRHTCASLMLRRRVPKHVVKRILGMSEKVLEQIYAHLNLQDLDRAAKKMRQPSPTARRPRRRAGAHPF